MYNDRKEDGEIYFLNQENGSQFVLGYNLIKVSIAHSQALHICKKERERIEKFSNKENANLISP